MKTIAIVLSIVLAAFTVAYLIIRIAFKARPLDDIFEADADEQNQEYR
jgi:hypothetical protein